MTKSRLNLRNVAAILAFLAAITVFSGCDKDKDPKFKVNFSNSQALLLKNKKQKSNSSNETTLFQIDEKGNVVPVIDGVTVNYVKTFSYGAYIEVNNGKKYIIYLDNTYIKLPDNVNFVGENEEGDLIFSDVSMIKKGTTELKKMQTALNNPRIQSMSGNFAVIIDYNAGITQIYNTVGGERYNIMSCNGPRIVALNKERALINDCQENALIDIKTGIRSISDVGMWNGEHIYLKNGAVIMSQGFSEYGFGIGIVDINGNLEIICNDGFSVEAACMNCGYPNFALFHSGDYFVVKELTQISVVKIGELTKKSILIGYNVISISVKGDKVFFIAEDNFGNKKLGFYSLTTEETILIITQEEFDEIFTF